MKQVIKSAFLHTLPVMIGYVFVGIAFGLLLQKSGYNFLWALGMSLFVYSGALQFLLVSFLTSGMSLIQVAIISFTVSSRHAFYGLSLLEAFKGMGWRKGYMIFSLTDETYSLLLTAKPAKNVDKRIYYFTIALFNQVYWVIGSVIGSTIGKMITFNTKGIDFAMTALFVVIFTEQLLEKKHRYSAAIGIVCAIICLLIFGPSGFILPSLLLTITLLFVFRAPLESQMGKIKEDVA